MKAREFFDLEGIQDCRTCVPFSYAVAIWNVTHIPPRKIIRLYEGVSSLFSECTSGYETILKMHNVSCDNLRESLVKDEFSYLDFWNQYEKAKALLEINKSNFVEIQELLKRGSQITAMMCLNIPNVAHSIAVTFDPEDNTYIMKDPNIRELKSDINIRNLILMSLEELNFFNEVDVGDVLYFKRRDNIDVI